MEEKDRQVQAQAGNIELYEAFSKLQDICREVSGAVAEEDCEQMCTRLTRQIRKVRECLTECRRRK